MKILIMFLLFLSFASNAGFIQDRLRSINNECRDLNTSKKQAVCFQEEFDVILETWTSGNLRKIHPHIIAMKEGCDALLDWNKETKCFQQGIRLFLDNEHYSTYGLKMCSIRGYLHNKFQRRVNCLKDVMKAHDDDELKQRTNYCERYPTWDAKFICYESVFMYYKN